MWLKSLTKNKEMAESSILKEVLLLSRENIRLFRNNVGSAWMGKAIPQKDGSIKIINPRRVDFGLCVGSSDAIGFKTVEITPDMVGQKVAIFVAIETKTATGKPTPEQQKFINYVSLCGGLAGVARSSDDAEKILKL